MMPIRTAQIPRFTVTMDFIFTLPIRQEYEILPWPQTGLVSCSISRSEIHARFWQALFNKLGTEMLTSTAYHPQTNDENPATWSG